MIYIATFYAVCALYVLWLVITAPEGWEDAEGWHSGKPD